MLTCEQVKVHATNATETSEISPVTGKLVAFQSLAGVHAILWPARLLLLRSFRKSYDAQSLALSNRSKRFRFDSE